MKFCKIIVYKHLNIFVKVPLFYDDSTGLPVQESENKALYASGLNCLSC
jgi:hypothetical protein